MAKQSAKKKNKKKKKETKRALNTALDSSTGTAPADEAQAPKTRQAKIAKALKKARSATSKLRDNPLVSEVVAAALVATAAAIKDPQKARQLAGEAADQLEGARGKASRETDAFWALALDIARRSLDALGAEETAASTKTKRKK